MQWRVTGLSGVAIATVMPCWLPGSTELQAAALLLHLGCRCPSCPPTAFSGILPFSLQGSYLAHTQGKKHQTNL